MKGIVISGLSDSFPSLAYDSGTITKEDTFRYAKRDANGNMRRIGYVGYVIRIECKWGLLTCAQYEELISAITGKNFDVTFRWQGSQKIASFYAGNITATPFRFVTSSGTVKSPKYYTNVSVSLISVESWT